MNEFAVFVHDPISLRTRKRRPPGLLETAHEQVLHGFSLRTWFEIMALSTLLLLLAAGWEGRCLVELANFTLAVAGKLEKPLGPIDCLFLRFDLKEREATDDF